MQTLIKRITKISAAIDHYQQRLNSGDYATQKQKHRFKREIMGKKSTLCRLCKIYVAAGNIGQICSNN